MFLFKCCQQFRTGVGYQLLTSNNQENKEFVNSLKQIDPATLTNENTIVIKIKKSEFEEDSGKKFIDHTFPANQYSLGNIQSITDSKWKRISQIIKSPELFNQKIQPVQVVQGSLGDCYFLSALAALAEKEERIRFIFGNQSFNSSGIYKIPIRIHGEIEEIIIDDFIPVNESGEPLFCQPNKNEFWVLILQKAWAKIHKSYANIIMGTPTDVFKAFTFAPSDMMIIKQKNEDRQKLWSTLTEYTKQQFPICCNTNEDADKSSNLKSQHSHTLLATALLQDTQGVHHKLVKLRDPWGKSIWEGTASQKDRFFWNKIINSADRKQFQKKSESNNNGIFYMTFNDFCQYFCQIYYCLLSKNGNYISEPLFCNKKNGKMYQLQIMKKGTYSFELHQSQIEQLKQQDRKQEGLCRSTMLLVKNNKKDGLDFINGLLKYNQEDAILTEVIEPGSYILYAKIDPTRSQNNIPAKTVVSVYSKYFTSLESIEQSKFPNFFKQIFLKHAISYKKNKYNNGLMWISWKLLFQQGGYAYIAMGNDSNSNKKFVIQFSEEQFNKMSFKLKGQFKNKGNQRIEVMPGQSRIIIARVENELIKSLKFPPHLGIKMQLIE